MLVIPRFRAMRPVRIEFGVHFDAAPALGVANFATVELKCLTLAGGDRLHSRNIERDGGRSEGVCKGVPSRPRRVLSYTSTEDGHVRLRFYFRCDDANWKCRFAHLAWCIWHGVARTNVSCRSALFTAGHPG